MIPSSQLTKPAPSAYWWGVSPVGDDSHSQLPIARPQCLLVGGFPSRVMIPSSQLPIARPQCLLVGGFPSR
ncbi:hypothetical protein [Limnospira platensis]|uniref:hypothetical protein n=1 Tax=Limnospira platensis TaxID=118562 RepID=UPI001686DF9C|nr:hypothetical protein [Arthrospira platensis FACHB-835]